MFRYLLNDLKNWLASEQRKPLLLRGARQVGKTWLVRELAKESSKQLIEINLEQQRQYAKFFESNDPKTILMHLQSATNLTINSDSTILFLDEIQATPELIAKLRWFYEAMPELPVIAAGSLLEFVLEKHTFSMPVGRINYCFVEPIGFEEFLLAKNETHLHAAIQSYSLNKPFNEVLHEKSNLLFKEYLTVGGMPEAVESWHNHRSLESLSEIQNNLINTYKDDFAKYAGKLSIDYLEDALNAIPKLLTKKTIYSHINPTARHASIKQAVSLLDKARLIHTVQSVSANGIPVGSEINSKTFKTILIDVGLASAMLGLKLYQFDSIQDIYHINRGAITEQVVGQLLRLLPPHFIDPKLYYWTRENQSASAEVDYLIQDNQEIIPIEVKSGSEGKLRSLHQFMSQKPWKTAIRFYDGVSQTSKINTKTTTGKAVQYQLISLPLYLVEQTYRLLESYKN